MTNEHVTQATANTRRPNHMLNLIAEVVSAATRRRDI